MSQLDFNASLTNVATPRGTFEPGPMRGIILVPKDTTIATKTLAGTLATYTTGINLASSSRWRVINFTKGSLNFGGAPTQDESVAEDTQFGGIRTFVRDGNKRDVLTLVNLAPETMKALRSYNGKVWEMFELYDDYIIGRSTLGTIMEGFHINFRAGNQGKNESGDVSRKFPIMIDYTVPGEWDDNGMIAPLVDFETEDLDGIENVELTEVGAATTAIVTVDVKTKLGNVGYTGLVDADFLINLTSDGSVIAHSGTVESTTVPGRYVITANTSYATAAHTVKTKDQPDATTKGVETPTALTFTPA